jgi:hypothetical protein
MDPFYPPVNYVSQQQGIPQESKLASYNAVVRLLVLLKSFFSNARLINAE